MSDRSPAAYEDRQQSNYPTLTSPHAASKDMAHFFSLQSTQ